MNWNFKKMGPAAALSIAAFTASLSASCNDDCNSACPPKPAPQCAPKPQPKCEPCKPKCEPKPCVNNCVAMERGPKREITPNAGPCVANGLGVFITADFIYWTAHEDNLAFASTSGTVASSANVSTSKGKVYHPDWKFSPGFKVGLGLDFDHDGWDLYANYTWFRSGEVKETAHSSSGKTLQDLFVGVNGNFILGDTAVSTTVPTLSSSHAKWHLHFNALDFELGRNFYISRYLMLRPHFGLKATWQTQRFNVSESGFLATAGGVLQSSSLSSHNSQDSWGIGIRAGLDTSWHFTKSFSMYGDICVSGLWEQFEDSRRDYIFNNVTGLGSSFVHTGSNYHTIKPVFEWQLGLRWETWWCDDQYHFAVEAGWEMQSWLDQNNFIKVRQQSQTSGDLILQGLTTGVRFDF